MDVIKEAVSIEKETDMVCKFGFPVLYEPCNGRSIYCLW